MQVTSLKPSLQAFFPPWLQVKVLGKFFTSLQVKSTTFLLFTFTSLLRYITALSETGKDSTYGWRYQQHAGSPHFHIKMSTVITDC